MNVEGIGLLSSDNKGFNQRFFTACGQFRMTLGDSTTRGLKIKEEFGQPKFDR